MLITTSHIRGVLCCLGLVFAGCNFKDTEALAPRLSASVPEVSVIDSLQTGIITLPYNNTGAIAVRCEVSLDDDTNETVNCSCDDGVCTVGLQRSLASSAYVDFDFTLWDAVGQSSSAQGSFVAYGTIPAQFVLRTTAPSESITLPLPSGFTYQFEVDWGDGSPVAQVTSYNDTDATHVFAAAGDHTITLTGLVQSIKFQGTAEEDKVISVPELGNVGWKSFNRTFMGCTNLTTVAGGDTSLVTNMNHMFSDAINANPDTSTWETGEVTAMFGMFYNAANANPDVFDWDVSRVTTMSNMFYGASVANPDVSAWVTSSLVSATNLFFDAISADPDISGWDVSGLTAMTNMFRNSALSNPDFSNWEVAQVTNMNGFLFGLTIDTTAYSNLLIRLAAQNTKTGVGINGGSSEYNAGAAASRAILVGRGWTVSDGGLE